MSRAVLACLIRTCATRCRSRGTQREEKTLQDYLAKKSPSEFTQLAYEVEGPFYYATFALLLCSPEQWRATRTQHLQRLLLAVHLRAHSSNAIPKRCAHCSIFFCHCSLITCFKYEYVRVCTSTSMSIIMRLMTNKYTVKNCFIRINAQLKCVCLCVYDYLF